MKLLLRVMVTIPGVGGISFKKGVDDVFVMDRQSGYERITGFPSRMASEFGLHRGYEIPMLL